MPSWTPPAYGDAQPAVDALAAYATAVAKAWADPAHANTAEIEKYANGQAAIAQINALKQAKEEGLAYRGTRPTSRVTVVSMELAAAVPKVVLRDCALDSTTGPYVLYVVATGKPAPQPTLSVPPPYAKSITVLKISGAWTVSAITTDATKTCQP